MTSSSRVWHARHLISLLTADPPWSRFGAQKMRLREALPRAPIVRRGVARGYGRPRDRSLDGHTIVEGLKKRKSTRAAARRCR